MEFNLKEVTITIVIGAYLLFGLEFLFYTLLKKSVSLHLLQLLESRRISPRVLAVVAIVSCFVFGMFAEALSDKLVDEDTPLQKIIGYIPKSKTDDEIKRDTLFGDEEEAAPLGVEAAKRDLLRLYGGKYGEATQKTLTCGGWRLKGISPKETKAVAKSLYYHAKNVIYKEPTYFNELQTIQLRIDFARSCIGVSIFLTALALILFLYTEGARVYLFRRRSRARKLPQSKKTAHVRRIRKRFRREDQARRNRLYYVLGFLAVSFLAGVYSYNAEEINFDKRAFGYFSSMNAKRTSETQCP